METLRIFGFAPSTYVQTARLAAAELGLDYVLEPLAFAEASHRALHPYLKMPALRHGEVTLFETLAIGIYLDGLRDDATLLPAGPANRAMMFAWISSAMDYLYRPLVSHTLGDVPPDLAPARACLAPLEAALSSAPYLAGAELSLADLFVAPMLAHATGSYGGQLLQPYPALRAWSQTMGQREAWRALEAA